MSSFLISGSGLNWSCFLNKSNIDVYGVQVKLLMLVKYNYTSTNTEHMDQDISRTSLYRHKTQNQQMLNGSWDPQEITKHLATPKDRAQDQPPIQIQDQPQFRIHLQPKIRPKHCIQKFHLLWLNSEFPQIRLSTTRLWRIW